MYEFIPTRENLREFITSDTQRKREKLKNNVTRFSLIAQDAILTSLSESKCFCTVPVSEDLLTAAHEYARQIERNGCRCTFELRVVENVPVLPPPPPPPVVHCSGTGIGTGTGTSGIGTSGGGGGGSSIQQQIAQLTQQRAPPQQWMLHIDFLQMIL